MIVAAEPESETAQVVESVGCGVVIPPGRPELLADAIRELRTTASTSSTRWGARGRAYVVEEADRAVAIGRYRALLQELVA